MSADLAARERYSFWQLLRRSYLGRRGWSRAWRRAEPRRTYDCIIVGAGGHGLATAYYLAKRHGMRNVAVLERGWLGGGNSGRNTQAVRSNYFYPSSARFFERSLVLYERLGMELDFNVMFSQRGVVTLAHSDHDIDAFRRWSNAIRLNGIDSEMLTRKEVFDLIPTLNPAARFPIVGAFIQRRGGIVRHDAVVWGYARAAAALGVDLIDQCAVEGLETDGSRIVGVRTRAGRIEAPRVLLATAGQTGELLRPLGIELPIVCSTLQAMVTEPVKPLLGTILNSPVVHVYLSQSDHGEIVIGGGTDGYNAFDQRGSLPTFQANCAAAVELMPVLRQLKILRTWAGIVDITPDTMPILGRLPIEGLFVTAGWGTGGFKAVPAGGEALAHTIAQGTEPDLIAPFGVGRFEAGSLIDEAAAAGVSH
jgi:sarcosine oxidase, subunit beta